MATLNLPGFTLGIPVWTGSCRQEECGRDFEEIQDGGLQAHVHTSSFGLEED